MPDGPRAHPAGRGRADGASARQLGLFCPWSSTRHGRRGAHRAGHSGCLASEVGFSKGYRHFASVISLAKCGSAVKAEVSLRKCAPSCRYRCENSPWRAAPGPGRPEAPRYSRQNGPRAASAFQRDALGQETTHWGRQFAYPNALLPTPMREDTRSCLPQCGKARHVACPNALLPTPMGQDTRSCLPQWGKARRVAHPNAGRHAAAPRARRSTAESTLTRPSARRVCPRSLFQSDSPRDRRCNKSSAPTAPSRAPSPAPRRCRRRA